MTPAGTSNELDVQNEWEENTHTHTIDNNYFSLCLGDAQIFLQMFLDAFRFFFEYEDDDHRVHPTGSAARSMYVRMITQHMARVRINQARFTNPARGQLNRENEYFPVRVVRACEFDLARRVRQSRPASVCSSPFVFRLNLVLT